MTEEFSTNTGMTRRSLLTRGAVGGAALLVPGGLGVRAATAAALATVDMEMTLLGCQVDPPRSDTGLTPGAAEHVKIMEQALNAKGLLETKWVDGHFGSLTISAYSSWQRSLGYSGLDANGAPGRTSLTKVGEGRFSVVRPVLPGDRYDSYGGRRTNTRAVDMLRRADSLVSWGLGLTQGSYTNSNPGSAGTHSGGGVVDIGVNSMSTTQRWQTIKALRTVGFAAWLRTPDQGFAYHIHAVGISDPDLASQARDQVHDYYFGRNGLASHGPDNTPSEYRVPFTWWEKYLRG